MWYIGLAVKQKQNIRKIYYVRDDICGSIVHHDSPTITMTPVLCRLLGILELDTSNNIVLNMYMYICKRNSRLGHSSYSTAVRVITDN